MSCFVLLSVALQKGMTEDNDPGVLTAAMSCLLWVPSRWEVSWGRLSAGGGLMVATVQLSLALGSTVGGLLFDYQGYQSTFLASALMLIISTVLIFLTSGADNRVTRRDNSGTPPGGTGRIWPDNTVSELNTIYKHFHGFYKQ
ncbi:hypothetical protein HA49_10785 [Tatumella morbirosei]|uniref:Uncharacterized protein n=1 Tax=Tatumella morbirosei TaxID=642227 RepID=A0A095UH04_9GAMM|nr:hypothetical protein HA49_10785 [Tatumella morbirosei]